jgi:hypothetical protein
MTSGRTIEIVGDSGDMLVVVDGVKIAKRGHPGTKHAGTWISLEPGWSVVSPADYKTITVTYEGVQVN